MFDPVSHSGFEFSSRTEDQDPRGAVGEYEVFVEYEVACLGKRNPDVPWLGIPGTMFLGS